jgi:transposase
MLFVNPLTFEEIKTLEHMHKFHPCHRCRSRAHIILLSSQGHLITFIKMVYPYCRQTIATCIHSWEAHGLCGLFDDPRIGRPPMLSIEQRTEIIEMVHEKPRSLKTVIADITQKFKVDISLSTLKRLCKQSGLSWKRIRKSLKYKRDPDKFRESKALLESLVQQSQDGSVDVFFFDESGFTLEPCVPYAWQEIGKTIEVPSSKSKRLNVLGFVSHDSRFESILIEGAVNTDVVVACFDQFAKNIQKLTFVPLDNASIHTSHQFTGNIERWRKLGLVIVPIATYSPELNIIEMLWKKIKYEWLPFSAYESYDELKSALFEILGKIGTDYRVQFTVP